MPTRSSKDFDSTTKGRRVVEQPVGEKSDGAPLVLGTLKITEKNEAAVALGRLGGAKGGKARAAVLSPERRAEIARKAAATRWRPKPNA